MDTFSVSSGGPKRQAIGNSLGNRDQGLGNKKLKAKPKSFNDEGHEGKPGNFVSEITALATASPRTSPFHSRSFCAAQNRRSYLFSDHRQKAWMDYGCRM